EEAEFVDDKVTQMQIISDKSFKSLSETTQKINTLIRSVKESSVKEEELAIKMQELKESTNDVKSILELIGDIAEQTNLLSLNAAIEAARAGEHGRGFAVVADEVRKLAERTQKSLTEINATINVVTQAVDDASENMQENAKDISVAAQQAGDVEESVDGVMNAIAQSKQMAQESSQAVDKLKARVIDISKNMSQLNDTSILNARSVEEIASAAEHQNGIMEELNKQLSSFKS
ncbi:methyl-accepting chemotaxis protein, partial [Sulfurimonas sp. SAG-AH-194-I05]